MFDQSSPIRVSIAVTCFNRIGKTIQCLSSLAQQAYGSSQDVRLSIFLVDDGSRDGTTEVVARKFPSVNIIQGTGSLYWAGGMRLALSYVLTEPCEYVVFLNNDVVLESDALARAISLIEKRKLKEKDTICVGSTLGLDGKITYGGYSVRKRSFGGLEFLPCLPGPVDKYCDTMNGNFVCMSRAVFEKVGNISSNFVHQYADVEYGLRARRLGISLTLLANPIGVCEYDHTFVGTSLDR